MKIYLHQFGRGGAERRPSRSTFAVLPLIIHLGMTGQLTLIHSRESVSPHTHGFFILDDGRELRYTDIRRFGRMLLIPESGLAEFTEKLGKSHSKSALRSFASFLRSRRNHRQGVAS